MLQILIYWETYKQTVVQHLKCKFIQRFKNSLLSLFSLWFSLFLSWAKILIDICVLLDVARIVLYKKHSKKSSQTSSLQVIHQIWFSFWITRFYLQILETVQNCPGCKFWGYLDVWFLKAIWGLHEYLLFMTW